MKRLMALFLALGFLAIWMAGCAGTSGTGVGNQGGASMSDRKGAEGGSPIDLKNWTP